MNKLEKEENKKQSCDSCQHNSHRIFKDKHRKNKNSTLNFGFFRIYDSFGERIIVMISLIRASIYISF